MGKYINLLKMLPRYLYTTLFYKPFAKNIGKGTVIYKPLLLCGLKNIYMGNRIVILDNARIELVERWGDQYFQPSLIIGDGTLINQNCHITCGKEITIGNGVLITSNVTITDINHMYTDINKPISIQPISCNPVKIGEHSCIYQNSVVLPGVTIGKHCIIGANSVVNRNIPDYSVVAGNPVRIIRQYNIETEKWERVNNC